MFWGTPTATRGAARVRAAYIPAPLARLADTAGICLLPSRRWLELRAPSYPYSRGIGARASGIQSPPVPSRPVIPVVLVTVRAPREYASSPRATGSRRGYMPRTLARLVRAAGICSLPSRDWYAPREHASFPRATGSRR
eukprot:579434-Pyramimonas_sp.AAC.1